MNPTQENFLDLLRAIAAQLVLFGHAYSMLYNPGAQPRVGDLGVLVFFLLSGFLICYTSLVKREANSGYGFRLFFVDRFFRIFTVYVPALFFVLVMDYSITALEHHHDYERYFSVKNFFATFFMLQQYPAGLFADKLLGIEWAKLSTFGSARPFWTVASEWWLYLFFGWLLFKYRDISRRSGYFILILLFFGVVPLFNMSAGTGAGLSLIWFLSSGFACFYYKYGNDLIAWRARVSVGPQLKLAAGCLAGLLLALLALRIFWVSFVESGYKWGDINFYDFNFCVLLMLAFFGCFLWLGTRAGGRRNRIVKFFAAYSYALYLVHYTLFNFILSLGLFGAPGPASFMVSVVAGNLLGIFFWWAFDRHYRRIKDAWLNYRTR